MNYFELGNKLIKAREEHGWSVSEEAKKANISRNSISRYEDATQVPKFNTLAKLAKLLGLSLDYLAGFKEEN